ncbi:hypothetical protein TNCV_657211 [Trichonephila clavipes]|nr:hypothetical protein TNCV_657211 [Trichonephila clavipes]
MIQPPVVALEEPPLCNAGPHPGLKDRWDYAPADREAGDMLVRLSQVPVLSGRLRRKTQIFSGSLYMAVSSRPHFTSPKVLRSTKLRSKSQFSQGAVCCVIIPMVKTIRHNFIPLSPWSARGIRGRKK